MKCTDCSKCVWADISDSPRVIVKGNTTFYQSAGSINCTCKSIKKMTITDDGMVCSSYKEKVDRD